MVKFLSNSSEKKNSATHFKAATLCKKRYTLSMSFLNLCFAVHFSCKCLLAGLQNVIHCSRRDKVYSHYTSVLPIFTLSPIPYNWNAYNGQIQACISCLDAIFWPALADSQVRLCSAYLPGWPIETLMPCVLKWGGYSYSDEPSLCFVQDCTTCLPAAASLSYTVYRMWLLCSIFVHYPHWIRVEPWHHPFSGAFSLDRRLMWHYLQTLPGQQSIFTYFNLHI